MDPQDQIARQAATAADLVRTTAEATATALNIQYIQKDIVEIKQDLKDGAARMEKAVHDITARDELFVRREEFVFWRNLLVSGMLLTITLGVVMTIVKP